MPIMQDTQIKNGTGLALRTFIIRQIYMDQCSPTGPYCLGCLPRTIKQCYIMEIGMMQSPTTTPSKALNSFICSKLTSSTKLFYLSVPWFTDKQHSGFMQLYSGILFVTVKGASHMVPQSKRAEAFNLFKQVLDGHMQSNPYFKKNEKIKIE